MSQNHSSRDVERCEHSRRQFLGGALSAVASAPLLGGGRRSGCRRGGEAGRAPTQDQAGAGRLRRPRKLDWKTLPGARRLRIPRRGRLLPARGRPVRRRSGRGQESAFLRPFRLQEGDRKRRGGRGPDRAAVLLARTFQRRRRGGPARLHGQARGGRRARLPARRGGGQTGDPKAAVFLVDYQIPTDPVNIQMAERIRKGELGKLAKVSTVGVAGGRNDPPKTANIESRLQGLVWDNDRAIGGSFIVSFDIHAIDAAIWVLGRRPVAAMGASRICRVDPHGDSHDTCSVVYEYADGLIHEHSGLALPNAVPGDLTCHIPARPATPWSTIIARRAFNSAAKRPSWQTWSTSIRPERSGTSPRSTRT